MGFNPCRVFKLAATIRMPCDARYGDRFQSLSGFQARCNRATRSMRPTRMRCFNPCRVFKLAATQIRLNEAVQIDLFQSLSGFQARCNFTDPDIFILPGGMFQSLSGFQARCNRKSGCMGHRCPDEFQSLSGFQARCNGLWRQGSKRGRCVSIPVGFSSSLQRQMELSKRAYLLEVSIPVGFSSSLQLEAALVEERAIVLVSIPVGFSSSLQRESARRHGSMINGFNPCRVFKLAATSVGQPQKTTAFVFQSLSGFQARCNLPDGSEYGSPIRQVSIPVGFSSSLQHIGGNRG